MRPELGQDLVLQPPIGRRFGRVRIIAHNVGRGGVDDHGVHVGGEQAPARKGLGQAPFQPEVTNSGS